MTMSIALLSPKVKIITIMTQVPGAQHGLRYLESSQQLQVHGAGRSLQEMKGGVLSNSFASVLL